MPQTPGVKHFFNGSSVLVTGATGFVGKAIIEKLLRACPEVKNVYILVRQKKGFTDVKQRLHYILENPLFDKIKKEHTESLNKIIPMNGDIGMPSLSISAFDRTVLTSNVSVVIHAAATVKFNESLDTAMELNVNGLRRVLELCREMTHFKSLVYISTAYSNCDQITIEEKVYPPPVGADEILNHFSQHTEISDNVDFFHFVKESRPNTYSYSKALAEHVLVKEAQGLPICIVRPSIVTATWREPVAGWVDNVNNATGIFLGMGLGALKVLMMDPGKVLNFVPVDVVANMVLCAAWETATNQKHNNFDSCEKNAEQPIKIYNCCTPFGSCISNKNVTRQLLEHFRNPCALSKAMLYPNVHMTTSNLCYKVEDFLFQFLPAIVLDLLCAGKKMNSIKAYRKLKCAVNALEYFSMNEWNFSTENVARLSARLSAEDRHTFYLNLEDVEWAKYFRSYCFGIQKYIMKEKGPTFEKVRSRMTRLFRIQKLIKFIWTIFAYWILYKLRLHAIFRRVYCTLFTIRKILVRKKIGQMP